MSNFWGQFRSEVDTMFLGSLTRFQDGMPDAHPAAATFR